MKVYKLDKIYSTGTTYRTEEDKALIIEAIGTNVTDTVTCFIDGVYTTKFNSIFAPLREDVNNALGLLELGDYYLVVPPDKPFRFESATAGRVRVKGKLLVFGPGEVLPPNYLSRFGEQGSKYVTFVRGSYTSAAGASIPSGEVATLINLTPGIGERYVFNSYALFTASTSAGSIPSEDLAFRFYLDDNPIDLVETEMGPLGFTSIASSYPPKYSASVEIFDMSDFVIDLLPGKNLKVRLINNGPARTLASGETLSANILMVAIYTKA